MNKSGKLVSLFLSTALVISSAGCGTVRADKNDQDKEDGQQVSSGGGGFFGELFNSGPFSYFRGSSTYPAGGVRPGVTPGVRSGNVAPGSGEQGSPGQAPGITGTSQWGRSGSSSSSSSGCVGISRWEDD